MDPADEMVFGDVQFREPARRARPDSDPHRASIACGNPSPTDLLVFIDYRTADAIERHALSDRSVELGGILLGKECVDPQTGEPFVWITESLEARHYENSNASFTYTHDSWEEISRERERCFPNLDIVGWYHTHPDFGIFLSGHDEFLHRHFFSQPLQVAYVVDPVRNRRGFFHWRDRILAPVGGFYLIGDRGDRIAIARLANQLEDLPGGEAPTGLSPRLEAELITMIKRPHPPATIERAGLGDPLLAGLGFLLGGLLTFLAVWLHGVGSELREQAQSLRRLAEATPSAASAPPLVEIEAKRQVLDALLAEIRVGEPAEALVTRLNRVLDSIDAQRRRESRLAVENEALAALAEQRQREIDRLTAESNRLRQDAEQSEAKARHALDALARLESQETATGSGAPFASWLTWAAVAGWTAFLGATLLLLQRWIADRREGNSLAPPPRTTPDPIDPPATHVIQ